MALTVDTEHQLLSVGDDLQLLCAELLALCMGRCWEQATPFCSAQSCFSSVGTGSNSWGKGSVVPVAGANILPASILRNRTSGVDSAASRSMGGGRAQCQQFPKGNQGGH